MVRSERQRLHHHHYKSSNYSNHHVLVYNDTYRDVISTTCSSNYPPLEKMMMMNSSSPRDHSLCITESSTIPSAVMHLVMSSKINSMQFYSSSGVWQLPFPEDSIPIPQLLSTGGTSLSCSFASSSSTPSTASSSAHDRVMAVEDWRLVVRHLSSIFDTSLKTAVSDDSYREHNILDSKMHPITYGRHCNRDRDSDIDKDNDRGSDRDAALSCCCFFQAFPLVAFNANSWQRMRSRLITPELLQLDVDGDGVDLPSSSKSMLPSLLYDPHTLWKGISLDIQVERKAMMTAAHDSDSDSDARIDVHSRIDDVDTKTITLKVSLKTFLVVDNDSPLLSMSTHHHHHHHHQQQQQQQQQLSGQQQKSSFFSTPSLNSNMINPNTTTTTTTSDPGAVEKPTTDDDDDDDVTCEHLFGVDRVVYDSRQLDVTVWTQIRAPLLPICCIASPSSSSPSSSSSQSSHASCIASPSHITRGDETNVTVRFHEVVPDHYDIRWDTYKHSYQLVEIVLSESDGKEKEEEEESDYSNTAVLNAGRGEEVSSSSLLVGLNYTWTNSNCEPTKIDIRALSDAYIHTSDMHTHDDMLDTSGSCLRTLSYDIPLYMLLQSIPQRLSGPLKSYEVVVTTTFHATKRLLTRAAQPIDSSRGVVVSPSILVVATSSRINSSKQQQFIYSTPSFIIISPIPDASMPYNVITLVSTLLAFFLGSFLNIMRKRGV